MVVEGGGPPGDEAQLLRELAEVPLAPEDADAGSSELRGLPGAEVAQGATRKALADRAEEGRGRRPGNFW